MIVVFEPVGGRLREAGIKEADHNKLCMINKSNRFVMWCRWFCWTNHSRIYVHENISLVSGGLNSHLL